MSWLWLFSGMLLRTIHLCLSDFRSRDVSYIALAIGAGLVFSFFMLDEFEPGYLSEAWLGLPVGYAFVVAFLFRDKILPTVTEGTLFGYGLIGAYIFFTYQFEGFNELSFFEWLLLAAIMVYVAITTILVLMHKQVGKVAQGTFMLMFIGISVYIGLLLALQTLNFEAQWWELVLVGYVYLPLIANMFYLYGLFDQTDSLKDTKEYIKGFEEKYLAVDSSLLQVALTLLVFVALFVAKELFQFGDLLLISLVLTFITFVHAPPGKSVFMPMGVYRRL